MRPLDVVLAASALVLLLGPRPAPAQFSNHGLAVESGLSSPLGAGAGPGATFALTASTWLEGDVAAVARVARTSAGRTGVRAAASVTTGTLGLRLSLGHAPVRPQLFVDAGWASVDAGGGSADRAAFGAGAGLEWFPASDVSVAPRATLRVIGGEPSLELILALGGYF